MPDPSPDDTSFASSLSAAARKAGFGQVADGGALDGRALLGAMGGVRGIIEAILPGMAFLILYTFSKDLPLSLGVSVGVAVVFSVARLIQRSPVTLAVGGLVGVLASAALALLTNRPEDNFVLGFITNSVYGGVLLISVVIGWPLIGVAVGYLMGDGLAWREDRAMRRVMTILTLCWVGLFAVRLAVQLPLYFTGNVEWLAATKLLMGIPLYAPLLMLSWLMARSVFRTR